MRQLGSNLPVVGVTLVVVCACVLLHYEMLGIVARQLARRHESQRRRKVLYGMFAALGLHVAQI